MKYYVAGFVGAYYVALWAAWQINRDVLVEHWPLIAAFEHRARVGVLVAPWAAALLSATIAGLNLRSYAALGDRVLTPRRALVLGWISTLIANWLVVTAILRIAIDKRSGAPWMEAIGVERFNITLQLAVPTVAYLTGFCITLAAGALRQRQEA